MYALDDVLGELVERQLCGRGLHETPFKTLVSGTRDRDEKRDEQSLCAVVDVQDDIEVMNQIKQHYPDFEIRFINEKPDDWQPPRGRFP